MQLQPPLRILRASTIVALVSGIGLLLATTPSAGASTYTVTQTGDSGAGSLRQVILDANAHAGADRIEFRISSGTPFIQPASALPDISGKVYIDGWSQPGYADDPVVIDGSLAGEYADGFHLTADSCTIRGLVIQRWGYSGIRAYISHYHLFIGNHVGVGADGVTDQGNEIGVNIQSGIGCTIGGSLASDRNVISGNGVGVTITTDAINNKVLGNYIGLGADGRTAVPNDTYGVWVHGGCFGTTIGGAVAGAGNVISGNGSQGIWILDSVNDQIRGNIIGLDHAGSAARGNGGSGIRTSATGIEIGGTTSAARNVISGNVGHGIEITSGWAEGTRVLGNYIGTDDTGMYDRGNGGSGIALTSLHVKIGGLATGSGNLISGNDACGIVFSSYAAADTVQGNVIGLNAEGTGPLGNSSHGILVMEHAASIVIGAAQPAGRNVISANGGDGIKTTGDGPTRDVHVIGNYIGSDVTGALDRGNAGCGLDVAGLSHRIGGLEQGEGNLISGNDGLAGINLATPSSHNQSIQGNSIGTAADGTALGNAGDGISVRTGAYNICIGGGTEGRNLIAYNGLSGVAVLHDSTEAFVLSNSIYSNQQLGISLGGGTLPTPNDPLDADTGPNGLQNYPVLTLAAPTGAWGTLSSTPLSENNVQIFASSVCDPSGYGEGMRLLGTVDVTTNEEGNGSFYCLFETPTPAGSMATATATCGGCTSEFSACMIVDEAAGLADGTQDGPAGGPALSLASPGRAGQAVRIIYRVAAKDKAMVTLGLYDVLGRNVRNLVAGPQARGTHDLAWDGADDAGHDVPPGVYLCRLDVGGVRHTGRLVLLR